MGSDSAFGEPNYAGSSLAAARREAGKALIELDEPCELPECPVCKAIVAFRRLLDATARPLRPLEARVKERTVLLELAAWEACGGNGGER